MSRMKSYGMLLGIAAALSAGSGMPMMSFRRTTSSYDPKLPKPKQYTLKERILQLDEAIGLNNERKNLSEFYVDEFLIMGTTIKNAVKFKRKAFAEHGFDPDIDFDAFMQIVKTVEDEQG